MKAEYDKPVTEKPAKPLVIDFDGKVFRESMRTTHHTGQVICNGIIDMGDYDERCIVDISSGTAVAYVLGEQVDVLTKEMRV